MATQGENEKLSLAVLFDAKETTDTGPHCWLLPQLGRIQGAAENIPREHVAGTQNDGILRDEKPLGNC